MPGATNKRGQADGQRFMLLIVDGIRSKYGECHVHAVHTCGRSKSICRAKPTYLVPDTSVYDNADACLRDDRMGTAKLV